MESLLIFMLIIVMMAVPYFIYSLPFYGLEVSESGKDVTFVMKCSTYQ